MTGDPEVLLVTQFYWPEPIGSAPYCTDLAEWLARSGWRVAALTCRPHYPAGVVPEAYRDGSRDRERHGGVAIERLAPWRPGRRGAFGRLAGELAFLLRGLAALATGRAKRSRLVVSLCPSVFSVLLGRFACRRDGRHFALIHDIQSGLASGLGMVGGGLLPGLLRQLERRVLNGADCVFVLSDQMRRRLRRQGVTTAIEVLPIWVDAGAIRPLERRAGEPTTVLYSGNLGRKQALDQVLALAEVLQRRDSSLRVVIRGEGGEAARLQEEARRRRLGNVEFRPLLPLERLSEGLAEGDVHLVPQDEKAADYAVPSKVYGIMAAGRPFVATARPGTHLWQLQETTGACHCVPPADAEALAEAVLALGVDARRRAELGARGRAFVERHHDKAVVLGRLEAALRRVATEPSGGVVFGRG
ncbi:colanic acid biosynthesis glycosyl transferase WcaI [Tistlia consotensis]|uniref:Colanic acid biosynthesis glycosyl transferase WcaI n=1 Tax=Tistlia consotensis USBA 355 TaxID=560819 RepID=A0A1Y6CER2_9PROT|nr:glycosyltransferase [Tistlia consotensis]SMF59115.1 colanic acid biosynthesis glycosyl transferase WcaI [Tistlia consotensis USBA 355]SNR64128.1 colanic acid biosynthesis glycosyl transferase WcaI [Tistlia consotensis]